MKGIVYKGDRVAKVKDNTVEEPMSQNAKAAYEISQLSEIIETLNTL